MAYRVEIARRAERDLNNLYRWVIGRAPHQGAAWFNRLERAITRLDRYPKRFPVAPEVSTAAHLVRVLNHGRRPHVYRVFFTIDERSNIVYVLHIRHGARQPATAEDVKGD
jgi:plasmid stabilization system protein ParE